MKKRTWLGILLLCAVLSGCGSREEAAAAPVLGQAAGLDENGILLVIDGREIPAWQYLYWLASDCRQLEEQCAAAGTEPDWDLPLGTGETLAERVKADALADTALYAAVQAWAEEWGCTLTEEEQAALPRRDYPWLTETQGRILTETGQEYARLYALFQEADSPLAPTAEELEQFGREHGFLRAEGIPVPAGGDRETAGQRAAELFGRVNGAEDSSAAFDALLKETGGGELTEADWTDALRDAAAVLEPGQISGVLETDAGFWILRRLPTDTAAVGEAYFDRLLQDAAETSRIQCAQEYGTLNPAAFWKRIKERQTIT